jgi:uncharacterized protein
MPLAVVTGASAGIGRCVAKLLAQSGYDLILVARRQNELEKLVSELPNSTKIQILPFDLNDPKQTPNILANVSRLEVLINCAGVGTYGPVSDQTLGEWERTININCLSLVSLSRFAAEKMTSGGAIINVSSLAGDIPIPYMAVYSASKAFVTNFSLAFHQEVKSRGIKVVAFAPGGVSTGFVELAGMGSEVNKKEAHLLVSPDYVAKAIMKSIKTNRSLFYPLRTGLLIPFLLWLIPRPLRARLAGNQYRKYLR